MSKSYEISRLIGFITSMIFSTIVIFSCSFGIVGIFQALSTYDLNDMSAMSNQNADAIIATITGISIDDKSFEGKLINEFEEIINTFENEEEYSFQYVVNNAKNALNDFFDDFDTEFIVNDFKGLL